MAETAKSTPNKGVVNNQEKKLEPAGKVSQKQANYREAEQGRSCAICANFEAPDGCKVVDGTIAPEMVSDMFMPMNGEEAMRVNSPMGMM